MTKTTHMVMEDIIINDIDILLRKLIRLYTINYMIREICPFLYLPAPVDLDGSRAANDYGSSFLV